MFSEYICGGVHFFLFKFLIFVYISAAHISIKSPYCCSLAYDERLLSRVLYFRRFHRDVQLAVYYQKKVEAICEILTKIHKERYGPYIYAAAYRVINFLVLIILFFLIKLSRSDINSRDYLCLFIFALRCVRYIMVIYLDVARIFASLRINPIN